MNFIEKIFIRIHKNKVEKLYEWLAWAVVSQALDINSEAYEKIQTLLDEAYATIEKLEEGKC